jgi:hypothetical protein
MAACNGLDANGQHPAYKRGPSYAASRARIAAIIIGPRHRPSGGFPLRSNLKRVRKIRSEKKAAIRNATPALARSSLLGAQERKPRA